MPSPEVVEETLQNVVIGGIAVQVILIEIRMRKMQKNIEKLQELDHEHASVEPDAEEIVSPEREFTEGQAIPEPAPA